MKRMVKRQAAVVIPARNEEDRIAACLEALADMTLDPRLSALHIVVLANNCTDGTAAVANAFAKRSGTPISVERVTLEAERAHAGWARRCAFEAGLARLSADADILLSTDADTLVAKDWLAKTMDHFDEGYDAVAGWARLHPRELRDLEPQHRMRLAAIRRYEAAIGDLLAARSTEEPWPRHFYEGGASMAVTVGAYRAVGGAPTPRVGEDKAMFEALRAGGRRVRHPKDVHVFTACRLQGRAPEGAAETLARWGAQDGGASLWGLKSVAAALGEVGSGDTACEAEVTFDTLPAETEKARALVRAVRSARVKTHEFRACPGGETAHTFA